jgi:hypothetical protein
MKVTIRDRILIINYEDLPTFKKGGAVVRNSYFWALKSISCYAPRNGDWEYDEEVWIALSRMLLSFSQSGYLGLSETLLEFSQDTQIPEQLRSVSTWL